MRARAGGEGEPPSSAGMTPKEASRLRVVDPACGSGSFLLGAYQFLLDWHRDWYVADDAEKHARGRTPHLYRDRSGLWRLTTAEKKRILLNNIYGVDIDPQAVEVTKLSLLLKILEGESAETLANQLRLYHERALPDLGGNIKCGNSLIGPDYYEGREGGLADDQERRRINAFDWQAEFPAVFKAGGFDAVIANPPYLFITEVPEEMRGYYQRHYHGVSYRFDLYGAFIEKAVLSLMRPGAILGFIVPHTLLSNDSFLALRAMLAREATLSGVVDFGPGVFPNAKNETMIVRLQRSRPSPSSTVEIARTTPKVFPGFMEQFAVSQGDWARADGSPWLLHVSDRAARVVERLSTADGRLSHFCTANQGLRTGDNKNYLSTKRRGAKWKPAAGGKQISRYGAVPKGLFVRYERELLDAPRRPSFSCRRRKSSCRKSAIYACRGGSLPRSTPSRRSVCNPLTSSTSAPAALSTSVMSWAY